MTVSRIAAALIAGSLALVAEAPAQAGAFEIFTEIKGVPGELEDLPKPPQPPKFAGQPNQTGAAVLMPSFMKNARKAKTAEAMPRLKRR